MDPIILAVLNMDRPTELTVLLCDFGQWVKSPDAIFAFCNVFPGKSRSILCCLLNWKFHQKEIIYSLIHFSLIRQYFSALDFSDTLITLVCRIFLREAYSNFLKL